MNIFDIINTLFEEPKVIIQYTHERPPKQTQKELAICSEKLGTLFHPFSYCFYARAQEG